MAGEGFGTTSIGTGGAQVVGSPTYNLERYAKPILQKQKDIAAEKAAKQKRQEKIFGDLKGLSKIGSLRYAPATEKVKNTVIEAYKKAIATQDVGDLMALEKAKLDYNTVLDLAKQNDDFANKLGSQMIQGGNFWNKEKFDNYYTPLDANNINTAEDLIKQMTLDRNDLGEVRRDKHDPEKFAKTMEGIGEFFYGNEGSFTEDDLRDSIDYLFKNDDVSFDTFKHYLADAEKNADLLKKFNGDVTSAAKELAFNDFKAMTGVKPKGKGLTIVNNNNMGGEDKGNFSDVAPVKIQAADGKILDGIGYSYTPIDYQGGVPTGAMNIDGTPYEGKGVIKMSVGQTVIAPVATKDFDVALSVRLPNGKIIQTGKTVHYRKGQYIPLGTLDNLEASDKYTGIAEMQPLVLGTTANDEQVLFPQSSFENVLTTRQPWGAKGGERYKGLGTEATDKSSELISRYPNTIKQKSTAPQNAGGKKGNVINVDIDWSKYGK